MKEVRLEKDQAGTGGAATAGGIWYQALYSVLLAVEKRLAYQSQEEFDAPAEFTAEPSDGGDLQIRDVTRLRVIQFKKKDDGGSWSLKKVIEEVLPDLFKATGKETKDGETWSFEFVTAGRIGRWQDAIDLFRSLGRRTKEGEAAGRGWETAYDSLDDEVSLSLDYKDLSRDQKTARGLFDFIVESLRGKVPEDGKPDTRPSLESTRARTWRLLCGFEFMGDRSVDWCESQLRGHLLRISQSRTGVDGLLEQMVGAMVQASTANDANFTSAAVLEAVGLDRVVALGDLTTLSTHCRDRISQTIRQRGYIPENDIRRERWKKAFFSSASVLITGESGNGKSWGVYAAADTAKTPAVAFIDARDSPGLDAHGIVQRVAEYIWQVGLRHDAPITMETLVHRLNEELSVSQSIPWLTLCIDHIDDPVLARSVVVQPWASWGVRLVVGLSRNAQGAAEQAISTGTSDTSMFDTHIFSLPELKDYLDIRLGQTAWLQLPAEMHGVLQRPQMAKLYADLKGSGEAGKDWRPTDEYDLVDTFWARLDPSQNGGHARDELRLRQLARLVVDGEPYPWTIDQIDVAGVDDVTIDRLVHGGWLQRVGDQYQMPHDRLLGYAVARSIVGRCHTEGLDAATVASMISSHDDPRLARRLGFLMMDWFHLALRDGEDLQLASDALQRLVEDDQGQRGRDILTLLPTLGSRAIPLLAKEARRVATSQPAYVLKDVLRGLAAVLREAPDREPIVRELLDESDHRIRVAGLDLMAATDVPELLDRAWELHREILDHPERYTNQDTNTKLKQHLLRETSFGALKSNVKLRPEWLRRTIEQAGTNDHPDQLAWLMTSLEDDGETWRTCKRKLCEVMPASGARSLASNIGLWQDHDEIERLDDLIRQVLTGDKMEAAGCVRAMIRLDFERAVQYLVELDDFELYMSRHWLLPPLLANIPDATRAALLKRIRALPSPINAITWYQGFADLMDETTLRVFLEGMSVALAAWAADEQNEGLSKHGNSWLSNELGVLTSIVDTKLLSVIASMRSSSLEQNLERFAVRLGARSSVGTDSLSREPVAEMLLRIGGVSYGCVSRLWLQSTSWYGRLDGIDLARRCADDATREELLQVVAGDGTDDEKGDMLVRQYAILTLARQGDLDRLLRLSEAHADDLSVAALEVGSIGSLADEVAVSLKQEAANANDQVASRAMALLTLGGVDSAVDQALAIIRSTSEGLAHSASLGYLQRFPIRDKSEAQVLLDQGDTKHQRGTINALLATRSETAAAALRDVLHERWEPQLAAILLTHDMADESIRQLAVHNLSEELRPKTTLRGSISESFFMHMMHRDPAKCQKLLREVGSEAHEVLMRDAVQGRTGFHTVGSRRDAIRGLAAFDEAAAADCAERGLRNPDYPDRKLMPSVLYELRPERAREAFLDVAVNTDIEDDQSTASKEPRRLMRAMRAQLIEADRPWLVNNLQSTDLNQQLAAVRLSIGPSGLDNEVLSLIQCLTMSRSSRVSQEAETTRRRLAKLIRVRSLLESLSGDATDGQAAAAVDAIVTALTERNQEEVGESNEPAPVCIIDVMQHPAVKQRRALSEWAAKRFNETRRRL